jgi:hypothetical protein
MRPGTAPLLGLRPGERLITSDDEEETNMSYDFRDFLFVYWSNSYFRETPPPWPEPGRASATADRLYDFKKMTVRGRQ